MLAAFQLCVLVLNFDTVTAWIENLHGKPYSVNGGALLVQAALLLFCAY